MNCVMKDVETEQLWKKQQISCCQEAVIDIGADMVVLLQEGCADVKDNDR